MSFSTSTKVACSKGNQYWTSNLAAVWGQMVTGGGFNPLQECMSVLGIPVMSKQSFMQTEHQIGQWWWDALQESITAAGKEEKNNLPLHKVVIIKAYLLSLLLLMEGGVSAPINTHIMHCQELE